jgi:hypothetical protein
MSFIPNQNIIGQALAIAGLSLVAPSSYLFRSFSRTLDFAQMLYVFSIAYAPTATIFSSNLGYSFLSFMPNFLTFCTQGDYVCTNGYLLSPGAVWLGLVILTFIVSKLVCCTDKTKKYHKFYNFLKGFMRWFMPPLVYSSTGSIIIFLQTYTITSSSTDFIVAAGVLGFFALWFLIEVIGYKIA